MTTATARGLRGPRRPLKSPLAVADRRAVPGAAPDADAATSVRERIVLSDRAATLAEFEDYLRTTNNRDGRPSGNNQRPDPQSARFVRDDYFEFLARVPTATGTLLKRALREPYWAGREPTI